jgi:hypothetical protein
MLLASAARAARRVAARAARRVAARVGARVVRRVEARVDVARARVLERRARAPLTATSHQQPRVEKEARGDPQIREVITEESPKAKREAKEEKAARSLKRREEEDINDHDE